MQADKQRIAALIKRLIADDPMHCRWLNTLSLIASTGARKITVCQHPRRVNETALKQAAEATRHAYYLKRQITKIDASACMTFEGPYLLARHQSYAYLPRLEARLVRRLRTAFAKEPQGLEHAVYWLLSYALAVRACALYRSYEQGLRAVQSPISVRGVLAEQEQYLADIETQLLEWVPNPRWWQWEACQLEQTVFGPWLCELERNVGRYQSDQRALAHPAMDCA